MRRHVPTLLGVALVVSGIVLYAVSPPEADYGWFAYTPLSEASPAASSADQVVLTRGRLVAVLLSAVGLLVTTAAVAYRAGRRRGPS